MAKKWRIEEKDGYCLIINEGGATLGISLDNKDAIVEVDGYAFKDLKRKGVLEAYEDWRLPMEERAADLAKKTFYRRNCRTYAVQYASNAFIEYEIFRGNREKYEKKALTAAVKIMHQRIISAARTTANTHGNYRIFKRRF